MTRKQNVLNGDISNISKNQLKRVYNSAYHVMYRFRHALRYDFQDKNRHKSNVVVPL